MRYQFPCLIPAVFDKVVQKMIGPIMRLRNRILCWLWGVVCGKGCCISGRAIFRARKRGEIVLGENVVLNSDGRTNLVGLLNPTIVETLQGGRVEIGDNTGASSLIVSSALSVKIGARCMIGGNVRIYDHDYHSLNFKDRGTCRDKINMRKRAVEIGNDCFIGANAIILKGTKIGDRSIVAAGSVVFGLEVPPDAVVKGNPGEVVRALRKLA